MPVLTFKRHCYFILIMSACSFSVYSQQQIHLTISSSHSTNLPWVGTMHTLVVPESNKLLSEMGSDYRLVWREIYGGSLYKYQDTLEAIEIGLTDMGWVGTLWEGFKMPLQNASYNAPFVTDDLSVLLDIFNSLHDQLPSMEQAWTSHNQQFLGASGVDTYHLMTNFEVNSLADLRGRKILAPGPSATWLEGTGAVAVDGGLTTYYTQIQTGVADGVLTILTGAYPYRIHEVAPYITLVGIGAMFNGGLSINSDTWQALPSEVKQVLSQLGREYSQTLAETVNNNYEQALEKMLNEGAVVSTFNEIEKQKWVDQLPDIAGRWAQALSQRGVNGNEVMNAFMRAVKTRIGPPLKDWTIKVE